MVIGFDGSRAFLKDKTGTENYSFQLLRNLSYIDIENEYYVYLRGLPDNEAIQGWPANFRFKVLNYPRFWTQIGLSRQTFKDPLDVLFVPAHTIPLIIKPGLKTVMTVHDLGSEYLPAAHQFKQALYLKWITKYQFDTVTRLIAVSESTKKDLIEKAKIRSSKISVVYEGVDTSFFNIESVTDLNSKLRLYDIEKDMYFLFVGTIQPRKNIERLMFAYAQLVKTRSKIPDLVLAGGRGWKHDQLYRMPKKLGLESKIKFLGRVSDSDLANLYKGACGLVYPSLFEGFGLPIAEAFASGCPVITSNVSSMPEIAGNAAILVDPGSTNQITAAMLSLLDDGKLKKKLVKLGLERVQNFSWEKCASETLKIFEQVGRKNES